MKICFFNRHAYNVLTNNQGPVGGAERAMTSLARQIALFDIATVTLVTQANDLREPVIFDRICIQPLYHKKKPLGFINVRPDLLAKFLWDEFRAIVKAKPEVICVSQAAIETMVVYFAARYLRVPIVYRLASTMELDHSILKNKMLFGRESLSKFFEYILRHADMVVAQTPEQAALYQSRFGRAIPVVCNMLTMPIPELSENDILSKRTILWVGRAHPMKHLETFFEIAKRMPQYEFVAIAPETSCEADYYRQMHTTSQEIGNLRLVPGLPPEQMREEYAKARLSIMTSESEGFPNVMAEAMANGAPFLTTMLNPASWLTQIATANEVATTSAACGYHCNNDLDCIIAMIERLMTDNALCFECAQRAQQQVRENMMPKVIAQKYYDLFERVRKH